MDIDTIDVAVEQYKQKLINATIGEYRQRLIDIMDAEHKSVYELCREIGIGWYTLNNLLNDTGEPYSHTLKKIKKYFQEIDGK